MFEFAKKIQSFFSEANPEISQKKKNLKEAKDKFSNIGFVMSKERADKFMELSLEDQEIMLRDLSQNIFYDNLA